MIDDSRAILEIDADFGSGTVTGTFEMGVGEPGKSTYREGIRTGRILDNAGSNINAIFQGVTSDGAAKRKGISSDVGGGAHFIEIDCQTPSNKTDAEGNHFQWGSSADPADGPNEQTATGAPPQIQIQVFNNYLRHANPDSFTPARLQVGAYSPDGFLDDHLNVVIEQPSLSIGNDAPGMGDSTLTLLETANLNLPWDANQRRDG